MIPEPGANGMSEMAPVGFGTNSFSGSSGNTRETLGFTYPSQNASEER